MALLNYALPKSSLPFSFSNPKFSTRACNRYIFHIPTSKFHRSPSIPLYLAFSASRNARVSAHLGRPTSRRNSLRKKLSDDFQLVRQRNPIPPNPGSDFQNPSLSFENTVNSPGDSNSFSVKEGDGLVEAESVEGWKPKAKNLGDSVLFDKLENWVDQYKQDTAYWGIGSRPIFTVFHDLQGNIKQVLVDEDEILKRSGVKDGGFGNSKEVDVKILHAKGLAREMERVGNVIPRGSSVAKFVSLGEESGLRSSIQSAVRRPEFVPVVFGVGRITFCFFVAIWAAKNLLSFGKKGKRRTEFEKEMMRRKIKARKEKEMLEKSRVEVVQEPLEPPMVLVEKPKLDKQQLMRRIYEAEGSKNKFLLVDSSSSQATKDVDLDSKIQATREMARQSQGTESREQTTVNNYAEEKQLVTQESSSELQLAVGHREDDVIFQGDIQNVDSGQIRKMEEAGVKETLNEQKIDDTEYLRELSYTKNKFMETYSSSHVPISEDRQKMIAGEVSDYESESCISKNRSVRMKPKIILSVNEAREFLAKRGEQCTREPQSKRLQPSTSVSNLPDDKLSGGIASPKGDSNGKAPDCMPTSNACEDLSSQEKEFIDLEDSHEGHEVSNSQKAQTSNCDISGSKEEKRQSAKMGNWIEENFDEVKPILKKIGDGFEDNYKVARENLDEQTSINMRKPQYDEDDDELEWMKDDGLREIVFQVRENELAGRDPFYLMDADDKLKFFKGLEKKVEKENQKLSKLHEYLHANIENLNYGADGISLYDPPEKIIPRWKGPLPEKNPEFLNKFLEQRNVISKGNASVFPVKEDRENLFQKPTETSVNGHVSHSLAEDALKKNLRHKDLRGSKTVIEGSDGSVRAGKKTGKEYWQHTKKWSREFLQSYSAETDPEVKSVMKDIGKDLDRWITEKEIQEAADLMNKLPERNKKFMEKKINKIKREMELFGPQAVVSKYQEYSEEKEEDYLWWLDLPHVLCVELYTTENGEQKIGFYSLEMAADLELEPKPHHVIAFQDAGDCKNLCYIIQAQMEMVGNGLVFVVALPPKDVFREAKTNGFSVTVIRKGELQLNVDQTLEEVEEEITQIGSKIYHDKLMRERSVDISSIIKGAFGIGGQTRGKRRKMLKRHLKKSKKK